MPVHDFQDAGLHRCESCRDAPDDASAEAAGSVRDKRARMRETDEQARKIVFE